MEYVTLNNGIKMPMAGIGVFMMSPAEAEAAVESALRSGVRLIDTANGYMNESGTGRGMKKSGVAREDIFLVTKLWPTVYEKETAVDETLARLGTDYIDLLFLHQPTDNWREGYKNIEKAYKEGKVKAIGLSNFPKELLEEAIGTMEIKPQMVQVEAHPYFPQTELKSTLAKYGMGLMAWYPLGHGDKTLINQPVFMELAAKYGKTNAQIILRWHVQSGNVVFPMILYTFFDKYDFSGKTIIPFNSHMGSGDGGTYDTIRKLEPGARVLTGLPVEMRDAENGPAKAVERWLRSLKAKGE